MAEIPYPEIPCPVCRNKKTIDIYTPGGVFWIGDYPCPECWTAPPTPNPPTPKPTYHTPDFYRAATLHGLSTCPDCNGTGRQDPPALFRPPISCKSCNGSGTIDVAALPTYPPIPIYTPISTRLYRPRRKGRQLHAGQFPKPYPRYRTFGFCWTCQGNGYQTVRRTCPQCNGDGTVTPWRNVRHETP